MDELVSQYDDPKQHMGMIGDWQAKGYEHYLDWFYLKWCMPASVEKQNEVFALLKNTGFIDLP